MAPSHRGHGGRCPPPQPWQGFADAAAGPMGTEWGGTLRGPRHPHPLRTPNYRTKGYHATPKQQQFTQQPPGRRGSRRVPPCPRRSLPPMPLPPCPHPRPRPPPSPACLQEPRSGFRSSIAQI